MMALVLVARKSRHLKDVYFRDTRMTDHSFGFRFEPHDLETGLNTIIIKTFILTCLRSIAALHLVLFKTEI